MRAPYPRVPRAGIAAAALVLAGACTDGPVSPPGVPTPKPLAALECRVEVRAETMACAQPQPSAGTALGNRMVGGQDRYVKLANYGNSYDSGAGIYQTYVTVQNLLADPLGTSDGTTVEGVRVFFYTGPIGTGGTVTVANEDGEDFFTEAGQPYFLYPQILGTYEISDARPWRFNVPAGVTSFSFSVYVSGPQADETQPLLDQVWSGGTSTDWSTAANWTNSTVPTTSSAVAIPNASQIPGAFQPVLGTNASILHLRIGTGSTLGLGGYQMSVGGNVDATGAMSNGTLRMTGSGAVLKGTVNTLTITGTVALQGTTSASGPVTITNGPTTAASLTLNNYTPLTIINPTP